MPLAATSIAIARRALDLILLVLVATLLATLALTRVVPAITGAPVFVVGGGSMEPAIHLGSVVIELPATASDLSAGDVVSIRVGAQQAVFTHRITRLVMRDGQPWIETRGDANPVVDPSILPASAVLGRVAIAVPAAGYVVQVLASFAGIAFVLLLAMVTVLGSWLLADLDEDLRAARPGPTLVVDAPSTPPDLAADRGAFG